MELFANCSSFRILFIKSLNEQIQKARQWFLKKHLVIYYVKEKIFNTIDTLDCLCSGFPGPYRTFCGIPGLHPLDTRSTVTTLFRPPDVTNCVFRSSNVLPPPINNHWFKVRWNGKQLRLSTFTSSNLVNNWEHTILRKGRGNNNIVHEKSFYFSISFTQCEFNNNSQQIIVQVLQFASGLLSYLFTWYGRCVYIDSSLRLDNLILSTKFLSQFHGGQHPFWEQWQIDFVCIFFLLLSYKTE